MRVLSRYLPGSTIRRNGGRARAGSGLADPPLGGTRDDENLPSPRYQELTDKQSHQTTTSTSATTTSTTTTTSSRTGEPYRGDKTIQTDIGQARYRTCPPARSPRVLLQTQSRLSRPPSQRGMTSSFLTRARS